MSLRYKVTKSPMALISDITPSETKPQQIRRKRYTPKMLTELAESVRSQGVLEPIICRLLESGLELVAGERRWRAADIAGLNKVPVSIRDLTDEEVITIQLHENLHRENPHPLDEAYNYGFMQEELKLSEKQIADDVGKEIAHIRKRLKLLRLPEFIRDAYERKDITLEHAETIAKYPKDDHEEIFSYCFSNYGHTSQALYPIAKAKQQIAQHYLLQLSKAPFPLDDTNLRPDGLTCLKCNQRTGANSWLFESEEVEGKDSCYNRQCYEGKVAVFVQIKRLSTATKVLKFPAEKAASVLQREVPVIKTRINETVMTNVPTVNIADIFVVDEPCAFTKLGVVGDGENVGKEVHFCEKPEICKVHRSISDSDEGVIENISAKNYQKEEDFQVLIGELVRRDVLKQVYLKISVEDFYIGNLLIYEVLDERLLHSLSNELLSLYSILVDKRDYKTPCSELTNDQKARLLFLKIFIGHCWMSSAYVPQDEIKQLAKLFEIDYQMIDAVKRLELAPESHRKVFYDYLRKIEDGQRETPIPQVYSDEWDRWG